MPRNSARLVAACLTAAVALAACGGGSSSGGSSSGGSTSSSSTSSSSSGGSSSSASSGSSSSGSSSSSNSVLASYKLTGAVSLIHDPSLIEANGTWYVYSTDASTTQGGFIPVKCSSDRLAWSDCGFVFTTMPSWVSGAVPGATTIWAPDISYFNGAYHLYYAVSTFGSNISAIGMATNKTLDPKDPAYKWVDKGEILSSQASSNFNAIDPNILVDASGKVWLSYGSFWEGIFQQQIDPATGLIMPGGAVTHLARRAANVTYDPIEGASIVHKGGYYYLFASWDFCCQSNPANSDYKIVVGRSASPNGPFLDQSGVDMVAGGGTLLLQGDAAWSGPGGQSAFIDASGNGVIAFHALNLAQSGLDYLFVNALDFSSGWPVIQPQ